MHKMILFLTSLLLLASCCCDKADEFTKYYEDGRAKPQIAFAPVIDSTSSDFSWSLGDEFSELVTKQIAQRGSFFVAENQNVDFISSTQNPFGQELNWVKKEFSPQEFVLFVEIVKHELVPVEKTKGKYQDPSHNLEIAVRLRVVDIRSKEPKVVLQELIEDSYYITKNVIPVNYNDVTWGTNDYIKTPMAQAHARIAKEIVLRAGDYILLAKSRYNG